jgi:hypothetical protein
MGILKRLMAGLCHSKLQPESVTTVRIPFAKTRRPRRTPAGLAIVSAFCCAALQLWASPQSANNLAASSALAVQVRLGDAPGGGTQIEAELRNLTDKTITAYKIALTIVYYDGREVKSGWTEDLVNLIGLADANPDSTFPGFGGFLGPSQTRIYKQPIGNGPGGIAPVRAQGTAVAIIYKDRTAAGDPAFIKSQFELRRQYAERMAAAIAEMDKILSDSEIHRAVTEQKNMPEVTNIPSAEKKFRQQLGARIESLSQGTAADRRCAQDLRLRFYDAYPGGGPLVVVQDAFDGYKAERAAYAVGSTRQEAK